MGFYGSTAWTTWSTFIGAARSIRHSMLVLCSLDKLGVADDSPLPVAIGSATMTSPPLPRLISTNTVV